MAQNPDKSGWEILQIPDVPVQGEMAMDARKAEFPPIVPLRPPKGAPNIVIMLIDDMGFGAPRVTGGPCNMPAMQKVADGGLLYNRFHTTSADTDPLLNWDNTLKPSALAYAAGVDLTDPRVSPQYADFSKDFSLAPRCRNLKRPSKRPLPSSVSISGWRPGEIELIE